MNAHLNKGSAMIRQLTKIQRFGWDAIIAGSAIRDSYHDKKISSVDFFISINEKIVKTISEDFSSYEWIEYWYALFNASYDTYDDVMFLGDVETYHVLNKHILAVWRLHIAGKKHQIILLNKSPQQYVIDNFDFGICMAYCDGIKMHFTNEFITDSLNHTITLYKENLSNPQLVFALGDHIDSLRKKYPGWQLQN